MLLPLRGLGAPCTQHRPAATPCRTLNTSGENCRRSSCRAARLDWPDGQSVISSVAESIKPAVTEEQVAIKRAAKAARLSGQLQQALQILQDGLQLYPQDLHLLALAASTSSKLGHHHQAQQYLDTALQLDSSNVRLLCTQAGAAGRRQQYDTARHLYQRAHDANRYNPVVLHSWATMEAAAGDWGAARELAEAAIAADSRYLQAYVLRARLDAACGDAAAARAWHQQAMQVHPAYAPNLHAWAQLEAGEGNWAAAEELLQRALEARGDHLPSWQLLCRVQWQQGQAAAAAETYQQGLQAVRHHPQLQHYWATLQLHSNQHGPALQLLEQLGASPAAGAAPAGLGLTTGGTGSSSSSSRPPDRSRRRMRGATAVAAAVDSVTDNMLPVPSSSSASGPSSQGEAPSAAAAAAAAILAAQSLLEPVTTQQQQRQQQQGATSRISRRALRPQSYGGTRGTAAERIPSDRSSSSIDSSSSSSSSSSGGGVEPDTLPAPAPSVGNGDSSSSNGSSSSSSSNNGSSSSTEWLPAVVQAAMAYARSGNPAAAQELYSHALARAPTNPRLLHSWAQFQLQQGDAAGAESALDQLEAVEPGNGYLCYLRGVLAQQQGELGSARGWFSKGLRYAGNQGALLCYEGLSSLEAFTGNLAGASALIATALSSRAATPRFLRAASNHYKRTGDMKRALGLAGRAARMAPQDYKNWLQLGVLHRRCKDYAAAAQCFQRGTQVAPGYPPTWYTWAVMTWRNCRDVPAARHLFEQATAACPRNATLWMEWALLEWEEGDLERSRELFQAGAAVPASRQHPPLYQAWAEREAAAGNVEVAAQLTETYERLLLRRSRPQGRSASGRQLS